MGRKVQQATEERVQWMVVKNCKLHRDKEGRRRHVSQYYTLFSHTFLTCNGICFGDFYNYATNSFILFSHRRYKSNLQFIFALSEVWKEREFDFKCSEERFKQPGLMIHRYLSRRVVKLRVHHVLLPPLNIPFSQFSPAFVYLKLSTPS